MTNTTPDQSRTPELPVAVATIQIDSDMVTFGRVRGIDTVCDGLHYLYTLDQLREYGRACVAAAAKGVSKDACQQVINDAFHGGLGVMRIDPSSITHTTPDVQEAEPVVDAEYTPVSEAHEAAIDEALGLTKMVLRFPTELMATLRSEADAKGVVLAAHIRDRLTKPPSGDAEDARRFRALLDAMFDNNDGRWRIFWQAICRARTRDTYIKAIDAAMLAKGEGK